MILVKHKMLAYSYAGASWLIIVSTYKKHPKIKRIFFDVILVIIMIRDRLAAKLQCWNRETNMRIQYQTTLVIVWSVNVL